MQSGAGIQYYASRLQGDFQGGRFEKTTAGRDNFLCDEPMLQ